MSSDSIIFGTPPPPPENFLALRRRLLRGMIIALWILGLPTIIAACIEAEKLGYGARMLHYLLLYLLFSVTVVFFKRLPFGLCVGVMLGCLYLIAIYNFMDFGFAGAGIEIFLTISVLATVLLGMGGGVGVSVLCLISMGGIGFCFVTGILAVHPGMSPTTGLWISWVTTIAVYTLLAGALVLSAGTLQGHLMRSVEEVKRQAKELRLSGEDLREEVKQRKLAESNLIQSQTQFKTLFEMAPDAIYLNDLEGNFLDGNRAAEKLMGVPREELIGKNFLTLNMLPPSGLPLAMALLEKNVRGEPTGPDELTLITAKGKRVIVEITTQPFLLGDRTVVMGIARDVSARKQLENRFNQAQKVESLGTLAAGIAHDFNNILSSVIGYTELAMDDLDPEAVTVEYLREVRHAGNRAKDLVKQILTFARQSEDDVKPIQISTIAKEVVRFIRSTIPANIAIRLDAQSDSLVMGDATQMHQVFMNLCTNAAQSMETDGGVLALELRDVVVAPGQDLPMAGLKPGAYLQIQVADTGRGIPPEIIGAIFDPYFTTKGPGEGTGMGLAMVHGIVSSCGGGIVALSDPGKGSTFTVCLPITRKSGGLGKADETLPPGGQERILFVDDEGPIARIGARILERAGYRVATRTSSLEALEVFRAKPADFDLVITDMTMPNMTGDQLAGELIRIRPDIPVILCTGYSKKIVDATADDIGVHALVHKPVARAELLQAVRDVLDRKTGR